MCVGDVCEDIFAHAGSFLIVVLCPDVIDWFALEEEEEEIDCTKEHDNCEVDVDDSELVFLAG